MTETWRKLGDVTPALNHPISWFKFVPHESVRDYLLTGWEVADTLFGTKHGDFAVLMRWAKDGEPK